MTSKEPLDLSGTSLGERTLDEAMVAALADSPGFRNAFLSAIGCKQWSDSCGGVLLSASRSVYEAHANPRLSGETDVFATWTSRSGLPLDVRIEHKADAQFQERQGERYAARAAVAPERASMTVLIAPQRYLDTANVQVRFFRNSIAAEKILEWMLQYSSEACASHVRALAEPRRFSEPGAFGSPQKLHVARRAPMTS